MGKHSNSIVLYGDFMIRNQQQAGG